MEPRENGRERERENWPRRVSGERRENWLNFLSPKTSSSFSLSIFPFFSAHSFIHSFYEREEIETEREKYQEKKEREELIHEFWYKNEYRTSHFHPLSHSSSIALFLIIFIRFKLSISFLFLSLTNFSPTLSGSFHSFFLPSPRISVSAPFLPPVTNNNQ